MKTKEQIQKYNKEYFARPEVIKHAKTRNARYRLRRKLYKKTEIGRANENKYRRNNYAKRGYAKVLLKRYNLTEEQYNDLVTRQSGCCAICLMNKMLDVDHCHNTGMVRGLLCGSCNRAIGLLKDSPIILERAIKYLERQYL